MKRAQVVTRKGHGRDRRTPVSPSHQVRRRAVGFKLEFLEERTLLSTTMPVYPPPSIVPVGLGSTYTTLSEQAHGDGLSTSSPGQYTPPGTTTTTASPMTMAELRGVPQATRRQPAPAPVAPGQPDPEHELILIILAGSHGSRDHGRWGPQ